MCSANALPSTIKLLENSLQILDDQPDHSPTPSKATPHPTGMLDAGNRHHNAYKCGPHATANDVHRLGIEHKERDGASCKN